MGNRIHDETRPDEIVMRQGATRWSRRVSLARKFERKVVKFALHKVLKFVT